jgi:hypothetical protein
MMLAGIPESRKGRYAFVAWRRFDFSWIII